jgi:hypothetical protein
MGSFYRRLPAGKRTILLACAVWMLTVGFGAATMFRYAGTPGRIAAPPREWPRDAAIRPSQGKYSLLLFVHPECPCSRASMEELARLMVSPRQLDAVVVFFAPESAPDWKNSDLYASARRIPGVRVVTDPDGSIGRQFGVRTSGQTLLFDTRGALAFNGGITIARGHAGDNEGVDAIAALLRGGAPLHRTTPVFGCSLYGEY